MPIVACLGVCTDIAQVRGLVLESPGDLLYRLGEASSALGASLYARATGQTELDTQDELPALDLERERARLHAVLDAFDRGWIRACHDLGDGGLAVALFEMAIGRSGEPRCGVEIDLAPNAIPLAAQLFSEATGFLCAVRPADAEPFEAACRAHGVLPERLGRASATHDLRIDLEGKTVLRASLAALGATWRQGLVRVLDEGRDA
jgi:phosphoribosylformylglycinamidine synthase